MTVFTAQFNAVTVAITTPQDLFELVPDSTTRIRILEVELNQGSDFGDGEAEIRTITFIRGFTTTGDIGSAVTPVNLNPYGRASVTTVAANNTTLAKDGTGQILLATAWHLQAGFIWRPPETFARDPFRRQIIVKPSQRFVIRLPVGLTDEVTDVNGTVTFEEIGKAAKD